MIRIIVRSVALVALSSAVASAQPSSRTALVARIDSIMQAPIAAGRAVGSSIAVVRGRDTIAIKGYGKANIELDVATPANGSAIYELGSVTKQFTGAAIMQLVEQGKVSLDDDVTKYVAFNTNGRKVTIRRLLDHTSGIRGYTEMPEVRGIFPLALPRDTLLRLVEKGGYNFEPGEEQIYNNSAFFLAGLVIEKASGMKYEDYVAQKLFAPAGMKDAHYCSDIEVRRNKTSGYDWGAKGPIQKRPLSHTWPYAAGSLCSTVRDLVAWNATLHGTRTLMSEASYRAMITPDALEDGYTVGYAKGLALTPVLGHRSLHHGGGINGWTTENLYFPAESLSIIVLYNSAGPAGPSEAAEAIAEAILGREEPHAKPVAGDINRYAGQYAGRGRGAPQTMAILVENGQLAVYFRGAKRSLVHVGNGTFTFGASRFVFGESEGKVITLRVDTGSGNNVLKRTN